MPPRKVSSKAHLGYKSANKHRRQDFAIKRKKALDSINREKRFERRKIESKNPELKEARLKANVPITIDAKRKWDNEGEEGDDIFGRAVDIGALAKRRKLEELEDLDGDIEDEEEEDTEGVRAPEDVAKDLETDELVKEGEEESDTDSMLGDSEDEEEDTFKKPALPTNRRRAASPNPSTTSTARTDLTPEALAAKFPSLFAETTTDPKVLITTSLNSTLHSEATVLEEVFHNSVYVRRSSHRFGHKFSIREIAKFATNRNFTTVVVLGEDQKRPASLDIVHLPDGPMLHYSLTNWVDGKRLPGHGKAMDFYPEIILNGFTTALGLVTGKVFQRLFPSRPELQGRQVVTLHNQRDFIFFRRHRYAFREKRASEKAVLDSQGNPMKGVEDIKAGLQELGPRFTLKLRRVDKGIQRASGQEWEWKGKTDRVRTKFQL